MFSEFSMKALKTSEIHFEFYVIGLNLILKIHFKKYQNKHVSSVLQS